MTQYLFNYDRVLELKNRDVGQSPKTLALRQLINEIDADLNNAKGFTLSDLRNRCNELLDEDPSSFTYREVKLHLSEHYGVEI